MTALTRPAVIAIQNEVAAALKAIGAKHGLDLTNNRATFSNVEIKFSVTLGAKTDDGINAKYVESWKVNHDLFGFAADDLGKEFRTGGRTLKIVGLDTKRRKFPVVVQETATGKITLMVDEDVLRLIGKPQTPSVVLNKFFSR